MSVLHLSDAYVSEWLFLLFPLVPPISRYIGHCIFSGEVVGGCGNQLSIENIFRTQRKSCEGMREHLFCGYILVEDIGGNQQFVGC